MNMNYLNLHTHSSVKRNKVRAIVNLDLTEKAENNNDLELFSVGIHPWFINDKTLSEDLHKIANFAEKNNCAALGECGLDRLKGPDICH